jgi:DNA-directed RNA polymerase specialized sigma24 family protein
MSMAPADDEQGHSAGDQSPARAKSDELIALFKARRDRLVAMVRRRVGSRLIARIDPEDVLQEVYLRARREWISDPLPREHRAWWLYRLVWRRTIELMRAALVAERNADREVPW